MNKTRLLFIGAISLTALLFSPSCSNLPTPASVQTVDLFNGNNLDGWRALLKDPGVSMEQVWSVQEGLLICRGEPMGYLYTEKSFTNFVLRVEWRWAPGQPPGNSGVLMRINGPPKPLPRCIEAQLKSGSAGDLYGFHGMKIDGDPARRKTVSGHRLGGDLIGLSKLAANEYQPGQWNTYEIVVNGPNIKVWVNGQMLNEAVDGEVIAGPIGLQSEGGEIHFRTVKLTPLP